MVDKTQPTRGRAPEPSQAKDTKKAAAPQQVVERAHQVYFLGIETIKRAHSAPPSQAHNDSKRFTVAKSGNPAQAPKKS